MSSSSNSFASSSDQLKPVIVTVASSPSPTEPPTSSVLLSLRPFSSPRPLISPPPPPVNPSSTSPHPLVFFQVPSTFPPSATTASTVPLLSPIESIRPAAISSTPQVPSSNPGTDLAIHNSPSFTSLLIQQQSYASPPPLCLDNIHSPLLYRSIPNYLLHSPPQQHLVSHRSSTNVTPTSDKGILLKEPSLDTHVRIRTLSSDMSGISASLPSSPNSQVSPTIEILPEIECQRSSRSCPSSSNKQTKIKSSKDSRRQRLDVFPLTKRHFLS